MDERTTSTVLLSYYSFPDFLTNIFDCSTKLWDGASAFIAGQYPLETAQWMQENNRTCRIAPRGHMKSTLLYAHFMWMLLQWYGKNVEVGYYSYIHKLSARHVRLIKGLIRSNRYFSQCVDLKADSESTGLYTWDGGEHTVLIEPFSILGAKRGVHQDLLYVDDPLQDPANVLDPVKVDAVNRAFVEQILPIAKDSNCPFHIVGTPQTRKDFFFTKAVTHFAVRQQKAIVDEQKKITLWPERFSWEEITRMRQSMDERAFSKEFQCEPVHSADARIATSILMQAMAKPLQQPPLTDTYSTTNDVFAGFDVGKHVHPSFLIVFEVLDDGSWKELHHCFMDGWEYDRQIQYVNDACETFQVDRGCYDATRGEFEVAAERGDLHDCLVPVTFNRKIMHSSSTEMCRLLEQGKMQLAQDQRTVDSMTSVTNDLETLETAAGHGDAFWGTALAVYAASTGRVSIV